MRDDEDLIRVRDEAKRLGNESREIAARVESAHQRYLNSLSDSTDCMQKSADLAFEQLKDHNPKLRIVALNIIADNHSKVPDAGRLVSDAAMRDSCEEVRCVAIVCLTAFPEIRRELLSTIANDQFESSQIRDTALQTLRLLNGDFYSLIEFELE